MKKYLIVGSGFQGRACAFDMLRNPEVAEVALCDASAENLNSAKKFLAKVSKGRATFRRIDAADPAAVARAAKGFDTVVSCVPYFLNLALAKAGRSIPARMAMMAITTRSSIRVKPAGRPGRTGGVSWGCLVLILINQLRK